MHVVCKPVNAGHPFAFPLCPWSRVHFCHYFTLRCTSSDWLRCAQSHGRPLLSAVVTALTLIMEFALTFRAPHFDNGIIRVYCIVIDRPNSRHHFRVSRVYNLSPCNPQRISGKAFYHSILCIFLLILVGLECTLFQLCINIQFGAQPRIGKNWKCSMRGIMKSVVCEMPVHSSELWAKRSQRLGERKDETARSHVIKSDEMDNNGLFM